MRHKMTAPGSPRMAAFVLVAMAGFASADAVILRIADSKVAADTKVAVSVRVEGPQGLGALQFIVAYDPDALEAEEADAGEVFTGLVESNVLSSGRMKVALAASEGVTKDGEIVQLLFTPCGRGATQISIEDAKAWEQKTSHAMAVAAQGGTLTIGGRNSAGQAVPMPYVIGGAVVLLIVAVAFAMNRRSHSCAGES